MTNIKPTVKKVEEEPKQPTPEPEMAPEELKLAADVPMPKIAKIPEPPPEPKPEEKKPEPEQKKPTPEPKPKETKKKDEFDVDRVLEDLLAQGPEQKQQEQADKNREKVGAGTGLMSTQRDAIIGMLQEQVERCWIAPIGAPNLAELIVSIEVSLGPNGAVQGMPQIVDTFRMGDSYYRAAAEAAQRAVVQCSPYQLPVEHYDIWKEIEFVMDPRKIAG
jgi:hypothetical protein